MNLNRSMKSPTGVFDIGYGPVLPDQAILETGRIPVANYVSPEFHNLELEHVFAKAWLSVCVKQEIPKPGDYIVREVLGKSIIIVHSKDGKIRAFYNTCPHRGTQVVWQAKGRVARFICPYHAWAFDTEGKLLKVPDEQSCFDNFDKDQAGLRPISCSNYGPFVFLTFDYNPALSLREYLGEWAERFDGLPWDDYPLVGRIWRVLDCNWKLGVDANSEAYHVAVLHARTVAAQLVTKENPFVHAIGHDYVGAHHSVIVPVNPDFVRPKDDLVYEFALNQGDQMSSVAKEVTADAPALTGFAGHPGINIDRHPLFSQDAFTLFPNFVIQTGNQGWYTAQFFPLGHDRTLFFADYGFRRPTSLRERFAREHAMMYYRDILIEDLLNMDRQQIAMSAGGVKYNQVSKMEIPIRHHEACVTASIDAGIANEVSRMAAE